MRNYTKIPVANPALVFFTADLHLFHDNIISLTGRPFKNGQEMMEALIRNWNAVVPQAGEIFVLGDMFWKGSDLQKCEKTMRRLNGKKWLIAGNHDNYAPEDYIAMGFSECREYLELDIARQQVVLSHYPLLEWNGFYKGAWHLHGHSHGKSSHFSHRVMDVGVDACGYMPVSWWDIARRLEKGMEKDTEEMRKRGSLKRHRPYEFKEEE